MARSRRSSLNEAALSWAGMMTRKSSLDEVVCWIAWLCFLGPAYKAGQDQPRRILIGCHWEGMLWMLRMLRMLMWRPLHPPGSEVNSRRIRIGPWKMLPLVCPLSSPGAYFPGYYYLRGGKGGLPPFILTTCGQYLRLGRNLATCGQYLRLGRNLATCGQYLKLKRTLEGGILWGASESEMRTDKHQVLFCKKNMYFIVYKNNGKICKYDENRIKQE